MFSLFFVLLNKMKLALVYDSWYGRSNAGGFVSAEACGYRFYKKRGKLRALRLLHFGVVLFNKTCDLL